MDTPAGLSCNSEVSMTPFEVPVTLTERQRQILVWFLGCWLELRPYPSIHELRCGFKLRSTNSIATDLAVLRGAGLIKSGAPGAARSAHLTKAGAEVAAWYYGHQLLVMEVAYARDMLDKIESLSARAKAWREEREREWSKAEWESA